MKKKRFFFKKKTAFLNFLEFYSRWKEILAPGAPAALRVCSIICSSCLWRWALCDEEQKKNIVFEKKITVFCLKKPLILNKKRLFFNVFEFYSRWKGLLAPDTKTHFQTAPICPMQLLFLLLAVRFGLQMPLEGPRGPNEPQIVFLGTSPK